MSFRAASGWVIALNGRRSMAPEHSVIPLDEPDTRDRVLIRGRVVLLPRAWRRCASGATFGEPPTMPQRRRAAPRLNGWERSTLDAITTLANSPTRRVHGVGMGAICQAIVGRSHASQVQQASIEEALRRLEQLGLIQPTDSDGRGTLYAPAAPETEDA